MKKIIITIAIASFALASQAQFTFGVRGGFNLTNFSEKNWEGKKMDGDDKSKFKPGFQIGVVGDYAISENFAIQPALVFATQGATYKEKEDGIEAKTNINLNYIQLPINAQLKFGFENMKVMVQAGPYLGYGLGGKMKVWVDGKKVDIDDDHAKIEMGGDEKKHWLKAFDFGVGVGAGLELGSIQIALAYQLGLMNIEHIEKDAKNSTKNNGLALTLTYKFGGNDRR
jgi:hypothetical protein